jgi:hypothetical protein
MNRNSTKAVAASLPGCDGRTRRLELTAFLSLGLVSGTAIALALWDGFKPNEGGGRIVITSHAKAVATPDGGADPTTTTRLTRVGAVETPLQKDTLKFDSHGCRAVGSIGCT